MIVDAVQISADGMTADGNAELLPRKISRHLFPRKADSVSWKLVNDAIAGSFGDILTRHRQDDTPAGLPPPLSSFHIVERTAKKDDGLVK